MMTRIKNILVPTDFSDASQQALRYACNLADAFGASLHLLHVGENPYLPGGYMELYTPPPELFLQVEREALKMLQAALSPEEQARYGAVFVYRQGAPAPEILHYVQEQQHIDLIVMGTHGRGAIARLLMGSVAEKVVRAAPCPVLTIRPPATAAGPASHAA
jgi:nucleotide-binding universal stress UspA family protein